MEPGSLWCHYKGGIYTLMCMARQEATGEPQVVYKRGDQHEYGEHWVRPLKEWHQEVEPGTNRFTRIKGANKSWQESGKCSLKRQQPSVAPTS